MTDRMQNALRHIQTATDVDEWAAEVVEECFKELDELKTPAKWVYIHHYEDDDDEDYTPVYKCSNCGQEFSCKYDLDFDYCPKCGKNMKGEDE